jgi:hypothetical protein
MRGERGFQQGPDLGALMAMALLVGVIAWAVWVYEGAWWEKALVGAGTVMVWIVGGLLGCLLFAGVAWLFLLAWRIRKKAALRRLLRFNGRADAAAEMAPPVSPLESHDAIYDDILRADPALCRQLVEAARRDGPLRRTFLRILMSHAPWSPEAESALYDGRDAVEPSELWSWLYWFRTDMPKGHPEPGERLVAALEYYLARVDDHDRRRAWSDCLPLAGESASWRRLAERYRGDLAALAADERAALDASRRQCLDRLMQPGSEPA